MCITNVADILTPLGETCHGDIDYLKNMDQKRKTANINGHGRSLSPLKNQREQKRTWFPPTTTFGILNLNTPKARKKPFGPYY